MRTIAVLASMLVCAPAAAAPSKKAAAPADSAMQFHVVRSAQAGCEPQCLQWIAAQGKIVPGTAGRFRKVLSQLGERKLPILIDSAGGAVEDALVIGRLIRAAGLYVVVTRTEFTPCAPADAACRKAKTGGEVRGMARASWSLCASSCAFILAAGSRRFVGQGAGVGVHQVTTTLRWFTISPRHSFGIPVGTRKTLVSEQKIGQKHEYTRSSYEKIRRYFAEMGIGQEVMPMILSTPNDKIRWLTPKELEATRLATHFLNGEQLLAGASAPTTAPSPAPVPEIAGYHTACETFGICEPGLSPSRPHLNVPTGLPPLAPAEEAK
jgi:hypothetical protein